MLFCLFFLFFICFSFIAVEVTGWGVGVRGGGGERGGVAGGVGQAVTAVHTGLNRKE